MNDLADYLLADHAAFDAHLARAAPAHGFDLDAFTCFRARLLRHIDIEESLLLARPLAAARQLRVEHRALELLLRAPPSRRLVGEIRQLLLLHMGAEEGPGGALEEHARALPLAEQRRLAQRARRHPFRPLEAPPPQVEVRTAAAALQAAERIDAVPT